MRIAVVHSFYSSANPSGENRVVEDQVQALRRAGHEVLVLSRNTDQEQGLRGYPLRVALRVATGRGPDPSRRLRAFRPDVVHIHNLFPNIGTSWVFDWSGPIVVSVHNFRAVCANALLFRDGAICTECPDHGQFRAVAHRCYRDSSAATIPLAISRHRDGIGLLRRATAVVTTSDAYDATLKGLVPGLKTWVIPNFGPDGDRRPMSPVARRDWVAIGRFSAEKGFLELVRAWPEDRRLVLIGDGPQGSIIRAEANGRNIEMRSSVTRDELREILPSFVGLVLPSLWIEAAPQVVVEAMGVGLPVIAHTNNGVARIVESTGAGSTFGDSESLRLALEEVEASVGEMSSRAVEAFQKMWTRSGWLASMTDLYESVVSRR